jgi:hypothetical protein
MSIFIQFPSLLFPTIKMSSSYMSSARSTHLTFSMIRSQKNNTQTRDTELVGHLI